MKSVSHKVLDRIVARLDRIDGSGRFNFDMRGRVLRCRPRVDLADGGHVICVWRRRGSDQRTDAPRHAGVQDIEVIFDVFALARTSVDNEAGDVLEMLLADIELALELPADLHLRDDETGRNLLTAPLTLTGAALDPSDEILRVEFIAVSVRCVIQHVYGDPYTITK